MRNPVTTVSLSLLYQSASSGVLLLSNATTGIEAASFTASNYTTVTVPQFLLPSLNNQVFTAWLQGQVGGNYTVQTSADLQNWAGTTLLAFTNAAELLSYTNSSSPCQFYRAKTTLVDFAPTSVTNESFNFTIEHGTVPFTTNGFFQLLTDTSDAGYQEIVGPSLAYLTAGAYTYTKTIPCAAVLTASNSETG